jgi:hypothetical protein
MIHTHEIPHISRPTNDFSSYSAAIAGSAALALGDSLAISEKKTFSPAQIKNAQTINGFQYCRLYTVAGIPIIDFIITYIILYVVNSLWFRLHQGTVLVAAIPLTIILNLLINPKIQFNNFLMILMLISIFLILLIELPVPKVDIESIIPLTNINQKN